MTRQDLEDGPYQVLSVTETNVEVCLDDPQGNSMFTLVEFEDATLSKEMQYGKDHETRDANKNVNLWTLLKRVMGHKPIMV